MTITLIPDGEPVTLEDCPPGPFLYDGMLGFKSEYGSNNGSIDAYCDTGEFFVAGVGDPWERRKVVVQPMMIAEVPVAP